MGIQVIKESWSSIKGMVQSDSAEIPSPPHSESKQDAPSLITQELPDDKDYAGIGALRMGEPGTRDWTPRDEVYLSSMMR